jgi:hypothetical protein
VTENYAAGVSSYGQPPKDLMLALRREFSLTRFLETGTFDGRTTKWAAKHFDEVVTIEASEELRRSAMEKHGGLRNVRWVYGDTRTVLRGEVERLAGPAVVWLDSHWSGGATYGKDAECPLLLEIEIVRAAPYEHYLFVDDARLFMAPPPAPHNPDHWPTLTQVVNALTQGPRPLEVLVLEDTFVAVPAAAKELVWQYAQDAATSEGLERNADQARATPVFRQLVAALRPARRRLRL